MHPVVPDLELHSMDVEVEDLVFDVDAKIEICFESMARSLWAGSQRANLLVV